eukprot:486212-Alexandrium_andersonii.AAC.1
MSASLVGSEMCIRDSAAPTAATRVEVPGVSALGDSTEWAFPAPKANVRTCLLYTSDAADDM